MYTWTQHFWSEYIIYYYWTERMPMLRIRYYRHCAWSKIVSYQYWFILLGFFQRFIKCWWTRHSKNYSSLPLYHCSPNFQFEDFCLWKNSRRLKCKNLLRKYFLVSFRRWQHIGILSTRNNGNPLPVEEWSDRYDVSTLGQNESKSLSQHSFKLSRELRTRYDVSWVFWRCDIARR